MSIYIIRTTSGREDIVLDMLSSKVGPQSLNIKAIFHPAEIKGYIFVEGSLGSVQKALHGMMHVKGVIEQPVNMDEIRRFLEYKKERIVIGVEDIVEIIGGPFKGEKGKIKRISKNKDEVTVELLEASTPIPVTIATEFVKVVKHATSESRVKEEGGGEQALEEG
jgi:transcriptional antiterminator NusG